MGVPLCIICLFFFVAFKVLSLSLIFVILITICLGVFLLGFILPGTLCVSWTWLTISFSMLEKFSAIISSSIFSDSFSSPSETPIMWTLVCLMLFQRSLRLSSFFFHSFSFFNFVVRKWFSPFCLPGHLSVLLPELFCYCFLLAPQAALVVKNPPANARDRRDVGSISEVGRSLGGEHSNPL